MSSSSDEGEIRENGVVLDSKATSSNQLDGSGVDRPDRNRARHSPKHDDTRSRRPPSPRGFKRSRDDDRDAHHRGGRGGSDPRHFKVHFEDAPRSARNSYTDLDRPSPRGRYEDSDRPSGQRYDSRDHPDAGSRYNDDRRRYADKRPRTRSPSPPYRSGRGGGRGRNDRGRRDGLGYGRSHNGEQAESSKYSAQNNAKQVRDGAMSRRFPVAGSKDFHKEVAKSDKGATDDRINKQTENLHIRYDHPLQVLEQVNSLTVRIPAAF